MFELKTNKFIGKLKNTAPFVSSRAAKSASVDVAVSSTLAPISEHSSTSQGRTLDELGLSRIFFTEINLKPQKGLMGSDITLANFEKSELLIHCASRFGIGMAPV